MKKHYFLLTLILVLASILRFWQLDTNPPSLYWDEASIAYNAFSVLKAGVDEHGVRFPTTHFLAYGDAKPPLYIYAVAVSMSLFGVNEFAVRFPSAVSGTVAVLATYYLANYLFSQKVSRNSYLIPLVSSLLLAISPWHLQMSRVGFEANLALTLFLSGLVIFLKGLKNARWWLVSAVLWIATLYTFNAYRLFLPLFLILIGILFKKSIITAWKYALSSTVLALILVAPLVPFVLSPQAKLRFDEVTIFKNHQPILDANYRQELNGFSWWSKILYNRRVFFFLEFLGHYTDHFKPDFLFFSGDVNPRLSVRDVGNLYVIEFPLLLIGSYVLFRRDKKIACFLIIWWLLAIIPAGVARETPHALRSLQILPVPQMISALGIVVMITRFSKAKFVLAACYLLLVAYYLDIYYNHYRDYWSQSWQYGYRELVSFVAPISSDYSHVYITQSLGRPHTYFLFYTQKDPLAYVANRDAGGDAFGFTETRGYDNYIFRDPTQEELVKDRKALIVAKADDKSDFSKALHIIYGLKNKPVFVIYESNI